MGHQFGDALLKTVAVRLRQKIGSAGKVGRLSGDEFLILMPGLDRSAACALLQELTDELREPMTISGTELVSTCSMGLACFPAHGDNGVELMRAADLALYRSKSLGRDMFSVFEEGMNTESERKLKIISALHRAVARDEFHLVFQPQYDISAPGRRVGLEVLLRWTDPDLGDVSPSEFIPLSHQCGLGLSIDLWVLKNALHQKAAWEARGESLKMSINTSASSFLSAGFGRNVVSMIRLYQLDPCQVQIEVTESTLMQKAESSVENLRILREAGVSISVDDFGTGFSSLAMIHNLLPSELKIDRSFVARIGEGDDMATKPLELILALAHTLGLRTVAEGIETEEQLAWLAARGCDVGQGYYLSPPVPCREVPMSRLAAFA
jgi:predicted signal transduction protein with EAL and GGDEF domain